ncbi:hypothetical protein [Paraburkholderia ginsengiterrae]|uniref:hypothetical protein n=1 Tax=Paraburkholderia ginsengiterrae TaxID=1462993 RepID=UPI0013F4D702|nr:hypothetical protein [Paraburkholderia ginsengiterrae]
MNRRNHGGCGQGAGIQTDGRSRHGAGGSNTQSRHISVAARWRGSASDKTLSCSEYQQRYEQSSHETNQQFHLELLEEVSGLAGWYEYWLADGSGIALEEKSANGSGR